MQIELESMVPQLEQAALATQQKMVEVAEKKKAADILKEGISEESA
jgi:hypothetical protein